MLFDIQLTNLLTGWINDGDNIVLGIDMNKDVWTGKLAVELKQLGLVDLILTHHPQESVPATFAGNKIRRPINAIFGTLLINIARAGYLAFDAESGVAPSDGHRMLWIEASNLSLLNK